jgi:hypothetical protein
MTPHKGNHMDTIQTVTHKISQIIQYKVISLKLGCFNNLGPQCSAWLSSKKLMNVTVFWLDEAEEIKAKSQSKEF